ncbi:MAG: hypothetical protein WAS73_19050 [Defluviicoccus sp.]
MAALLGRKPGALLPAVRWLDHCSAWRGPIGITSIIGEPYELSNDALLDLEALVHAGFELAVDSRAALWFPSRTLSLRIGGPALEAARAGRRREPRASPREFFDRERRPRAVLTAADEAIAALRAAGRDFGLAAVEEAFGRVAAPLREAMAFRRLVARPELLAGDALLVTADALGGAFGGLQGWTDAAGRAVITAEAADDLDEKAILALAELVDGGCDVWLSAQFARSSPAAGLALSVTLPPAAMRVRQEAA